MSVPLVPVIVRV
jgi:hypothetical protein